MSSDNGALSTDHATPSGNKDAPSINQAAPSFEYPARWINTDTPSTDEATPAINENTQSIENPARWINTDTPSIDEDTPSINNTTPMNDQDALSINNAALSIDQDAPSAALAVLLPVSVAVSGDPGPLRRRPFRFAGTAGRPRSAAITGRERPSKMFCAYSMRPHLDFIHVFNQLALFFNSQAIDLPYRLPIDLFYPNAPAAASANGATVRIIRTNVSRYGIGCE